LPAKIVRGSINLQYLKSKIINEAKATLLGIMTPTEVVVMDCKKARCCKKYKDRFCCGHHIIIQSGATTKTN